MPSVSASDQPEAPSTAPPEVAPSASATSSPPPASPPAPAATAVTVSHTASVASAASASIEVRLQEAAAAEAKESTKADSPPPLTWGSQKLSHITPLAHFPGPPLPSIAGVPSSAMGASVSRSILEHNAAVLPDPQYRSGSYAPSSEPERLLRFTPAPNAG